MLDTAAHFAPVVGAIKGGVEAAANPTKENVAAAVLGAIPLGLGKAVGKGLKSAKSTSRASTPVGRVGSKPEPNVLSNNASTTISNRTYLGHAIDQMQARGFVPSVVQDALTHGTRSVGNVPGRSVYSKADNNISVVVDDATGTVVTVRSGGN